MCPLGRRGARNGFSRSVFTPKYSALIIFSALKHMCPLGRRGAKNGFFRLVVTPKYSALRHMCPLGRRGAKNGFFRLVVTPKYSALRHMCPLGRRGAKNGFFRLVVTPKFSCALSAKNGNFKPRLKAPSIPIISVQNNPYYDNIDTSIYHNRRLFLHVRKP